MDPPAKSGRAFICVQPDDPVPEHW